MITKKNVIFVGGFKYKSGDGAVGGQVQASISLLESPISRYVEWMLVDSTTRSNPRPLLIVRVYFSTRRLLKFLYYLVTKKVDSVLIFSSGGYSAIEKGIMVYIARIFKKKVIISFRSGHVERCINKSNIFRRFISSVIRKSDYIICQGKKWKEYYQKISNDVSDKFIVIKNWIDIKKMHIREYNKNNKISILFMGSVEKNKGIYDIIKLFTEYRHDFDNIEVNICGKGPDYGEIEKLIHNNGISKNVKLRGWVYGDEKLNYYKSSDIFLLPSYYEGLPNVILEAMSFGKPVIATCVGAIPEIVQNKKTGILFKPGDIVSLRNAMTKLVNNKKLRMDMGSEGEEYIKKEHDINDIWKKIYKVL